MEDHTTCVPLREHLDMLLAERQRAVELIAATVDHRFEGLNHLRETYDNRLKAIEHLASNITGRFAVIGIAWTAVSSGIVALIVWALQHKP